MRLLYLIYLFYIFFFIANCARQEEQPEVLSEPDQAMCEEVFPAEPIATYRGVLFHEEPAASAFKVVRPFNKRDLTWAFDRNILNKNGVSVVKLNEATERNVFRLMDDVFAKISRVTDLTFSLADDLESADMVVRFRKIDGPGNTLAYAYFPGTGYREIAFDIYEDWAAGPAVTISDFQVDFLSVAIHELGHKLGLDHSDVRGTVMWPAYLGVLRDLQEDDINGLKALYQ